MRSEKENLSNEGQRKIKEVIKKKGPKNKQWGVRFRLNGCLKI